MTKIEQQRALAAAVKAARAAGQVMRQNLRLAKTVHAVAQHDIKLELDVRCQKLIEKRLRATFPSVALLGEEGVMGDAKAPDRWVVDPIDGTVNFAYGIPHACVSIALQSRPPALARRPAEETGFQTIAGVVYDPFCDELWTAIRGQPAHLNGKKINVSSRRHLREIIVAIGFAKKTKSLEVMLPRFEKLVHRVRKVRMMGSAALDLVYVACGRMDAYIEQGVRLWDIAAGGLIVECAGGEFWHQLLPRENAYRLIASNGLLRAKLEQANHKS
jgi:myo-inositol-1(or 4)-monophosphatase